MSCLTRRLQVQIEGLLLSALACLVLIACAAPASPPAIIITDGSRFVPATLTGRVGEQIVWRNRSQDRHHVVVESALAGGAALTSASAEGGLRSGDLFHNQEWGHRFGQPGIYRFVCAIHQEEDMVGVLTIGE